MMEPSPYRWTMTAEDSAPRTMIMANTPSLSALQSRTQIFSQFSGYEGRRCSCCSLVCGCRMENDNQNAGPDALPAGQYETGTIDFNPAAQRPYSGCTLELRKGPVDIPIMEPHLRAYALVNGRLVATTTALQIDLFGG
jgi:hypothetical protein